MFTHERRNPGRANHGVIAWGSACLLFLLVALFMAGPAIFSAQASVCGGDLPDTWIHMWAYWRARYAIGGHDAGYLVSHLLTYPYQYREPIAAFDPLLPLISVPFQLLLPGMSDVFNAVLIAGLLFTGLCAFGLARSLTRSGAGALLAGVVAIANPFIYRQIVAGYVEYAWWGVLILPVWLYLRTMARHDWLSIIAYIIAVWLLMLMSIYCAACFALFAAASLLGEAVRAICVRNSQRLRRLVKVQLTAVLSLLPLLVFWAIQLGAVEYRGIVWGRAFDVTGVAKTQQGEHGDIEESGPGEFLAQRALYGSLDVADLLDPRRKWQADTPRLELVDGGYLPKEFNIYSESVFACEWLWLLALGLLAFRGHLRDLKRWGLLGLMFGFLLLALGPHPIWGGIVYTEISLPYAWLYRWLPGFSRLVIPGRMFVGTMLCLVLLLALAMEQALCRVKRPVLLDAGAALLVALMFTVLRLPQAMLPKTPADVSDVYAVIAADSSECAVLELPLSGNPERKLFAQTVHGKPIYRSSGAEEWTGVDEPEALLDNAFIRLVDGDPAAMAPLDTFYPSVNALREVGFRYLVLHRDGFVDGLEYKARCRMIWCILGPPLANAAEARLWALDGRSVEPTARAGRITSSQDRQTP